MDLRMQVIAGIRQGLSISELADGMGVSRKTIYKWKERYEAEGPAGLHDRSRAPVHSPHALSEATRRAIIEARAKWGWGPHKLRLKLELPPGVPLPAESTIAAVLKQAGLARHKRRHRTPPHTAPFAGITAPNQTWCADFKGWFRTKDGQRCDPLTITDAHSRFLLCCQIVAKTDFHHTVALFETAFREYGLPDVIRTDNGAPFASRAPGGLSRLSMRWVRLGILPERIAPASPEQNGRHERMHLTLKQAVCRPPERTRALQQQAFDRFRKTYNEDRPHDALGDETPARCYQPSSRAMPRRLPALHYDDNTTVRRVMRGGEFKWRGRALFLSEIFAGEDLGLRALNDRIYEVLYGFVVIGWFDSFGHRFYRTRCRTLERLLDADEGQ